MMLISGSVRQTVDDDDLDLNFSWQVYTYSDEKLKQDEAYLIEISCEFSQFLRREHRIAARLFGCFGTDVIITHRGTN